MEKIINLKDLLKYQILDLYSAEEQIIESLPGMIDNVTRPELKEALRNHLAVTMTHRDRLDAIKNVLIDEDDEEDEGFFSALFGGSNEVKSAGIEGLIKEAKKIMNEDMTPEAMDAAIIGAAQKIEHYEIAGYGTVRAYASELKMDPIVTELQKTLKEEYEADDSLTKLALGQVNPDAENTIDTTASEQTAVDDDYDRLTNSVSIMSSTDPD
jgi:ferritin-like metal-binding protein YciE